MSALPEQFPSETTGTMFPWTTDVNQSISSVSENCIILGMNVTIPWNNPRNLVSREVEYLIDRIKSAIFLPILFLVGAPANVCNMIVFFKQDLKKRMNMCLFFLSMVDLIFVTFAFVLYVERLYTPFIGGEKYGPAYRYLMKNNIIGFYGFGHATALLLAIISTERCVCVLFPLRAQRCIPTKVLAVVIVVSVSVLVSLRFVISAQYQVTCFYEMRTERQSLQVYGTEYHFRNEALLRALNGIFFGFCINVGCPVVVIINTTIIAIRLRQTVKWRSQTSSGISSTKEIAITKTLIALSIEFVVLYIPGVVLRVSPMFHPQLSAGGLYANIFKILVHFSELCAYINSSVNFFVYYVTSTSYRETLHGLIGWNIPFQKIGQTTAVSVVTAANTQVDLSELKSIEQA